MNAILNRILFVVAISSGPVNAVDKMNIRFLAAILPEGTGEVRWVTSENQGDAFQLSANQLSEVRKVPARSFVLSDAKTKREISKVSLPEVGKSFVVLLFPDSGGTMDAAVVVDSPSFKAGTLYLFNHTEQVIVGHAGDAQIELKPGEGELVRPSGARKEGNFDVVFSVREQSGDRVLRTMRWPVQTRFRSYGFFIQNAGRERIEFRAVDEFVSADKKNGRGK